MNLAAGGLLDRDRDDLVFLLRAGAAHLDGAGRRGLHRIDILLRPSCTACSAFTHSTNSSSASIATGVRSFQLKGMPVASGVVKRFESVMMILCGLSARRLQVEEAFAAGATRLVDDDHRLLHQIVLGDDALDRPRHLIGAAAGAGGNDEFDGAHRLPCSGCGNGNSGRA